MDAPKTAKGTTYPQRDAPSGLVHIPTHYAIPYLHVHFCFICIVPPQPLLEYRYAGVIARVSGFFNRQPTFIQWFKPFSLSDTGSNA